MKRHWTAFYELKKVIVYVLYLLWQSIPFECSSILYLLLSCNKGNIYEIIYAIVLFYNFYYKLISILITKIMYIGIHLSFDFSRNKNFESFIVYINPSGVFFILKATTTMDGADRLY